VSNRRKLKGSGDKPDWQVAIVDGEPVQVVNAAEITGHLELAQVDEEKPRMRAPTSTSPTAGGSRCRCCKRPGGARRRA
jgi:hypothetical protein